MNISTTLPPAGQRHDRDDAGMPDGLTNGLQQNASNTPTHNQTNGVAIEVAAVSADEDAMDTTSDDTQDLVLPNGPAEPTPITPSSPPPAEPPGHDQDPEHATSTTVSTEAVLPHVTSTCLPCQRAFHASWRRTLRTNAN